MPSFDKGYSAATDAAGAATVTVRPRSSSGMLVKQVATEVLTAAGGTVSGGGLCKIKKNGWLVTPVVATGDAAGGDPPIYFGPTDVMTVEWTALGVAGLQCRATVFWDEAD
jgi:hypothetical protein